MQRNSKIRDNSNRLASDLHIKEDFCVYSNWLWGFEPGPSYPNARPDIRWIYIDKPYTKHTFHALYIYFPLFMLFLKVQSHEIFYPHFFHHSNLPGSLTNGLKYFRFWLRFRRVIRIFRGIILCRVNLPAVSYCKESISPQYHTQQSHSWPQPFLKTFTQA